MRLFVGLALGASLLSPHATSSPAWTLVHARHVLASRDFQVTDESQPDQPVYDLLFTRLEARSLRPVGKPTHGRWRAFGFAGSAHDDLTDADLRASFRLTTTGVIENFRGPPADTSQPAFPIRASFFYAWYPEGWTRGAVYPYTLYHPSLDFYNADAPEVVRNQVDAMLYAHLNAAIYSWFGEFGVPDTDARFWRYLAASRTTPLRWAVYYEREGYGDPSVEKIHSDLEYIRDRYAARPAYLKVGGRFVVFVYGDAYDSCAMADRWRAANNGIGAYIVLKAFSGYLDCQAQPDGWHQYSAALPEYETPPSSFMISPGFDEDSAPNPRLPRDPTQWRQSVADMIASNLPWQLVLTFNEWAEGTAVESAQEWSSSSGYGEYLDALHDQLP